MKNYRFGSLRPYDNDLETADEISLDPFSEEPHSLPHTIRLKSKDKSGKQLKSKENKR